MRKERRRTGKAIGALLVFGAFMFLVASVIAAGPGTITYQGRVKTKSGAPPADGNYKMHFSLWTGATGGKLIDLVDAAHIERELMMIKVETTDQTREEIRRMADIFRGNIIDVTKKSYVIEITGNSDKLEAFIDSIDGGRRVRSSADGRFT